MSSQQNPAAARTWSARRTIRVVVVGAPRTGKTALVSILAGHPICSSQNYQPSVGVKSTLRHKDFMGDSQLKLQDVSGRASEEEAREALAKADAVVLVFDGRESRRRADLDCLRDVWLPRVGPKVLERAAFLLVAIGDEIPGPEDTPS